MRPIISRAAALIKAEVLSLFGKEATNPYKGPSRRDMYAPTIEELVAKYAKA